MAVNTEKNEPTTSEVKTSGLSRLCAASLLFLGAFFGVIGFCFISAFVLGEPILDSVMSAHGVLIASDTSQITAHDQILISHLERKNLIIDSDGLVSSLIEYYGTIIESLVALLGVLGVIAFFVIRSASLSHASDIAVEATNSKVKTFFESKKFYDLQQEGFKNIKENYIDTFLIDIESSFERRLDAFEERSNERIKELEAQINDNVSKKKPTKKVNKITIPKGKK